MDCKFYSFRRTSLVHQIRTDCGGKKEILFVWQKEHIYQKGKTDKSLISVRSSVWLCGIVRSSSSCMLRIDTKGIVFTIIIVIIIIIELNER